MSTFEGTVDPNRIGAAIRDREPRAEHAARGLASKRIIVGYGFWIFLLSDIIMFSAFFATYAVLSGETAGGPSGKDLFDLHNVAIETACLLLSSFTCGLAAIGARAHNGLMYYGGMAATCVLGLGFLAIEIHEFVGMIWQIWWLVIVAMIGAFATFVVFAWRDRTEYEIPAEEVARIDRANRRARGEAVATVEALS